MAFFKLPHIGASGSIPVKMVLNEFANIKPIPNFVERLQLCRKHNLQLDVYVQARKSLARTYGAEKAEEIENSFSVKRYFAITEVKIAEEISKLAGSKTVLSKGTSTSQRMISSGNISTKEQKVEALSVSRIMKTPKDTQFLKINDFLVVAHNPSWWEIDVWNDGRIKDLRLEPDNKLKLAPLLKNVPSETKRRKFGSGKKVSSMSEQAARSIFGLKENDCFTRDDLIEIGKNLKDSRYQEGYIVAAFQCLEALCEDVAV